MVHRDRALSALQRGASRNCTSVSVASQDLFPMAAKVLFILPFQRVAGRTDSQSENLIVPAWAAHRLLG
jgi:hypothetical protein